MPEPIPDPDSQPAAAEDAGRIDASRRTRVLVILTALVLLSEIAVMQIAMVSVAIPKIGVSFPAEGASVNWIVTIAGIIGGATIALIGKLGDLVGKKKVALACVLLFAAGCLIDAVTSNWAVFLVGRALSSGALAIASVEYGLVRDLMPRKWIPVVLGVLGTGFGVGSVLSPVIAGTLTDHYSWRSIFWFLVIYSAAAALVFVLAVPETPVRVRQRLDLPGAVLFGAGVAAVLIYMSEGATWGWANVNCLAYLIGGLVALAVFVAWEMRAAEPMMELSLLRKRGVAVPMAAAFLFTMAVSTIAISVNYIMQTPKAPELKAGILAATAAQAHQPVSVMSKAVSFRGDVSYGNGYSILGMVLHVTIWTALFAVIFGLAGGFVCRRIGTRIPLIISGGALAVACVLWSEWHATWQEQVFIGVLYGLSAGFYYAASPNLLVDSVPVDRQGIASGMSGVFGSIGASVGSAIFTAIIAAHPFQFVVSEAGHSIVTSVPDVYTDTAYRLNYIIVGVIPAVVVLALALALRAGMGPARGGAAEASPVPSIARTGSSEVA